MFSQGPQEGSHGQEAGGPGGQEAEALAVDVQEGAGQGAEDQGGCPQGHAAELQEDGCTMHQASQAKGYAGNLIIIHLNKLIHHSKSNLKGLPKICLCSSN